MKKYDKIDNDIIMDYFTANVVKATVQISENKSINFSRDKANEYFNKTAVNKANEMLIEARKDSHRADLFNGLKTDRIDPLVKSAFNISVQHFITLYASEILEHSKL